MLNYIELNICNHQYIKGIGTVILIKFCATVDLSRLKAKTKNQLYFYQHRLIGTVPGSAVDNRFITRAVWTTVEMAAGATHPWIYWRYTAITSHIFISSVRYKFRNLAWTTYIDAHDPFVSESVSSLSDAGRRQGVYLAYSVVTVAACRAVQHSIISGCSLGLLSRNVVHLNVLTFILFSLCF